MFVYDGKTFTVLKNKDGKAFNNVWSIIEDKKGNIWFGDSDGLWRYEGSVFTKVSQRGAYAIIEDEKGNIWTTGSVNPPGGWVRSSAYRQGRGKAPTTGPGLMPSSTSCTVIPSMRATRKHGRRPPWNCTGMRAGPRRTLRYYRRPGIASPATYGLSNGWLSMEKEMSMSPAWGICGRATPTPSVTGVSVFRRP